MAGTFDSVTNKRRDLAEEFSAVLQTSKGLLSMLEEYDREFIGDGTKIEWLEDVEQFENDVLANGGTVANTDTSFTVAHYNRFQANMIIKWAINNETMRVISVTPVTGTDRGVVSVTRSFNGVTPAVTVADSTVIQIISRPVFEFSRANENEVSNPTVEYNIWETFREDIPFSERVVNAGIYGFKKGEYVNYNIEKFMRKMKSRLARAIMYGTRQVQTSTIPSSMNGILSYLLDGSSITEDGSATALSSTMVNNLLEKVYIADSEMSDLVLYMDTFQARKMAGFNTSLANQLKTVEFRQAMAAGTTFVTEFIGDLQATGIPKVVVDKDAPKGVVLLLNTKKIKIAYPPQGRIEEFDSKPQDSHPRSRQVGLTMTCSLEMKDHKYSHGIIHNITAS